MYSIVLCPNLTSQVVDGRYFIVLCFMNEFFFSF